MCFLILYAAESRLEASLLVTRAGILSFPYLPVDVDQWLSPWFGDQKALVVVHPPAKELLLPLAGYPLQFRSGLEPVE